MENDMFERRNCRETKSGKKLYGLEGLGRVVAEKLDLDGKWDGVVADQLDLDEKWDA